MTYAHFGFHAVIHTFTEFPTENRVVIHWKALFLQGFDLDRLEYYSLFSAANGDLDGWIELIDLFARAVRPGDDCVERKRLDYAAESAVHMPDMVCRFEIMARF